MILKSSADQGYTLLCQSPTQVYIYIFTALLAKFSGLQTIIHCCVSSGSITFHLKNFCEKGKRKMNGYSSLQPCISVTLFSAASNCCYCKYFCLIYPLIAHHLVMMQDGHFDIGMPLWNTEHINNSSTERDCVVEQLLLFPCCIAAGCSPEKKNQYQMFKMDS